MRSLPLVLTVAILSPATVTAQQRIDVGEGFSYLLPNGWRAFPPDLIQLLNERDAEVSDNGVSPIVAGLASPGGDWLAPPYVVIRLEMDPTVTRSTIRELAGEEDPLGGERPYVEDIGVKVGEVRFGAFDIDLDAVEMIAALTRPDGSAVALYGYMKLVDRGILNLGYYYSPERESLDDARSFLRGLLQTLDLRQLAYQPPTDLGLLPPAGAVPLSDQDSRPSRNGNGALFLLLLIIAVPTVLLLRRVVIPRSDTSGDMPAAVADEREAEPMEEETEWRADMRDARSHPGTDEADSFFSSSEGEQIADVTREWARPSSSRPAELSIDLPAPIHGPAPSHATSRLGSAVMLFLWLAPVGALERAVHWGFDNEALEAGVAGQVVFLFLALFIIQTLIAAGVQNFDKWAWRVAEVQASITAILSIPMMLLHPLLGLFSLSIALLTRHYLHKRRNDAVAPVWLARWRVAAAMVWRGR